MSYCQTNRFLVKDFLVNQNTRNSKRRRKKKRDGQPTKCAVLRLDATYIFDVGRSTNCIRQVLTHRYIITRTKCVFENRNVYLIRLRTFKVDGAAATPSRRYARHIVILFNNGNRGKKKIRSPASLAVATHGHGRRQRRKYQTHPRKWNHFRLCECRLNFFYEITEWLKYELRWTRFPNVSTPKFTTDSQ